MKRFHPLRLMILFTMIGMNSMAVRAGTNVWTGFGPDGGPIQGIAVDPQNPNTVYALAGGAIFKTTDGAANWSRVYSAATSGGSGDSAVTIAVNPQDSNTLYAGTANGIFKSIDGGASWSAANTGLPKPLFPASVYGPGCATGVCIRMLAIDPWNPDTLYAVVSSLPGTSSRVFKSTDGGASWSDSSSGLFVTSDNPQDFSGYAYVTSLVINPQDPNTLYAAANAGSSGGLFKSMDGGASWTRAGLPRTGGAALAMDPRNPSTLYAWGTFNPSDGILKSTDGGATWSAANSGLPPGYDEILSLTIDPQNADTIYASLGACHTTPCNYSAVFKSTDGGTKWKGTGLAYSTPPTVLAIDPVSPATIYAGTYNGIAKSTDGGASWNTANSGLTASRTDFLAIDPLNVGGFYAITQNKVLRTADGGEHWSEVYTPLSTDDGRSTYPASTVVADPSAPGTIYVGIGSGNEEGGGGILKSTDDGTSWKRMPLPGPGGVRTLNVDAQNPSTLVASTNRALYKSTDAGASWNLLFGTNQRNYEMPSWCVVIVVIDARNPSTMYIWACQSDGSQGLFKSIDGGQTWSSLGNPLTSGLFGALAIDPQNGDALYVSGYYDGVLKTTDGGQNWRAFTFTSGLPPTGVSLRSIVVDPQNSNTVYAAGYGLGVYRSTNGGANWKPLNAGLADLNVQNLLIDTRNPETVYVGTNEAGVFGLTLIP
jgi:photosystem II stability/assembly factor-like uncharacterized protein